MEESVLPSLSNNIRILGETGCTKIQREGKWRYLAVVSDLVKGKNRKDL